MGSDRYGEQLCAGGIREFYVLFQTVLRESESILGYKWDREILEELVLFVVDIASLYPSAVFVGIVLNYLMDSLVDKAVDMVVIGSLLVYGKVINSVGGLEDTVGESVREIEGGKSPYLCRLSYSIGSIVLLEAEKLHSGGVAAETDNV